MVEHSARILNSHMVGHDGEVPYQRATFRSPHPTQVESGEQVLAKHSRIESRIARKGLLMKRATLGTWVGIYEPTSEMIVTTEEGKAIRTRTIFRRSREERWNVEVVNKIESTPVRFDPNSQGSIKIPEYGDTW